MEEIKKILDVMVVPEERRVSLASFMLRDEVDNWWDMIKTSQDVTKMVWMQFEESCFYLITFQRLLEDKKELNLYTWFKGT